MAAKITRDMSEAPRDASRMSSDSHSGIYAVFVLVAVLLGLVIYSGTPTDRAPFPSASHGP